MWPGVDIDFGFEFLFIATNTVFALSSAEIPVVTPLRASMLTVKAVFNLEYFCLALNSTQV